MEGDASEVFRKLGKDCLEENQPKSAAIWFERLLATKQQSQFDEKLLQDQLLLATAYYRCGQYHRAFHTLDMDQNADDYDDAEEFSLDKLSLIQIKKLILACRCLIAVNDHTEALEIIESSIPSTTIGTIQETSTCSQDMKEILASVCQLRGFCYKAVEDRNSALKWFMEALRLDPFCIEAFEELIDRNMLLGNQEQELLEIINVPTHHTWLKTYYECRCTKYFNLHQQNEKLRELEGTKQPTINFGDQVASTGGEMRVTRALLRKQEQEFVRRVIPPSLFFRNDVSVASCRATWFYRLGDFDQCYQVTSAALHQNPHALEIVPTHMAVCMQLENKDELFKIGHKLINLYPNKAVSLYAIGCYYMLIHEYEQAENYYHKAIEADPDFAPAWMGNGDSFAAREGSNQAMTAYRRAARMFPGLHQPILNMGMEYVRTRKLDFFATSLFSQALQICPTDPHIVNEIGVMYYHQGEYKKAHSSFLKVIQMIGGVPTKYWEPTVVNRAHCLRKLRRFNEAIKVYEIALGVKTGQADTYAALGLTYQLDEQIRLAIQNYHCALALAPNHAFAREMLQLAVKEEVGL